MGVKGFYRWLVEKYPKIIASVKEENGCNLEYDHLYLDMNEIIHHCFHPDNAVFPPTTFEQVFRNIFSYIDSIFSLVKPRKLLYLAIDGVAPRAKLNQQRSRIFRFAKDDHIVEEQEKKLREKYERKGKKLLPVLDSQVSDPNIISPGTVFMSEFSIALKSYITERLKSDPRWKEIKVILSGSTVVGEGEHKIMSFIRTIRSVPGYNPNTRHCVYGQDSDLIMLSLATHEIYISIIREEVHSVQVHQPVSLQFLHVWILREYLELDMQIIDPPDEFVFDFERIIDDFVFMCTFTGTDFLPAMPTLDVFEEGIALVMHVYKTDLKNIGGYLVDMQRVNEPIASFIELERVEKFILLVGSYEEMIFKKRRHLREIRHRRILSSLAEESRGDGIDERSSEIYKTDVQCFKTSTSVDQYEAINSGSNSITASEDVKLGFPGWKQRYYKEKFSIEGLEEAENLRKDLVQKYTEGLCWVLMYYYSDLPSWNWYYPYYYGLFASEFKGLAQVTVNFNKSFPFKPFDQLMAILPPKSAHALPKAYRDLMISSESEIVDFYPRDFEVDTDGKRFIWQGICKLPFIDQEKLLNATSQLEAKIEMNEAKRNVETTEHLFWKVSNSGEVMLDYIIQHSEKTDGFQKAVHDEEAIICCNFTLPVPSLQAPRLLEGALLPEKTVFESDIFEIQLWHEYIGRPLITRKAAADEPVVEKHTRSDWSGGARGKGQSYCNIPRTHQNHTRYGQSASFSSEAKTWRQMATNNNQNGSFWPSRREPDSRQNSSLQCQCLTWRRASNPNRSCSCVGNTSGSHSTTRGGQRRGSYGSTAYSERSSHDPNRW